jgi:hypothetical protein
MYVDNFSRVVGIACEMSAIEGRGNEFLLIILVLDLT